MTTLYLKVYRLLAPCNNMNDLLSVWQSCQTSLKAMPHEHMKSLEATKDFYKRMILDRTIDDYLTTRARVAAMHKKPEKLNTSAECVQEVNTQPLQ